MLGTLFLIVGPSGVGKDTLIAAARDRLREGHSFPRRTITRPAQAGGEEHNPVDIATFEEHERSGAFALSWRAHGIAYGVPASVADDLARGVDVVVNVSRTVVAEARARFASTRVVLITASPETLRKRLHVRGREIPADIEDRLERAPSVAADTIIANEGALEPAVEAFVTTLKG